LNLLQKTLNKHKNRLEGKDWALVKG
jgi:hypothetical protein